MEDRMRERGREGKHGNYYSADSLLMAKILSPEIKD